jgi:predicted nuclease of predicted toxin-antitoxin system
VELGIEARHVFDVGLAGATDIEIFHAARRVSADVVTKDMDFVLLSERHGPPPKIVWITIGNTSNRQLWKSVAAAWPRVEQLIKAGEPLIEIGRVHRRQRR